MRRVGIRTFPPAEISVVFLEVPLEPHDVRVVHAGRTWNSYVGATLGAGSCGSNLSRGKFVTRDLVTRLLTAPLDPRSLMLAPSCAGRCQPHVLAAGSAAVAPLLP